MPEIHFDVQCKRCGADLYPDEAMERGNTFYVMPCENCLAELKEQIKEDLRQLSINLSLEQENG